MQVGTASPPTAASAGGVGVILAVLEKLLPEGARRYVPSPASIGLAFVVPALYSLSMFIGGAVALAVERLAPEISRRYSSAVASGLIAGESLIAGGGRGLSDHALTRPSAASSRGTSARVQRR